MKTQAESKKFFFSIIIMLACASSFASDIYAPCMLSIAKDMSTSVNNVQFSMSIYLFGIAFAQLFYGPISEGLGRKIPLIIGMVIMIIGIIICIFAQNIDSIIIGRLVQGLGAGACGSLWRAIFRDKYEGADLAKYTSYAVIFIVFIVPAAPLVGGYIEETLGWRWTFGFLLIYSGVALGSCILKFEESNNHYHISKLKPAHIYSQYIHMLKSRIFMGTALTTFVSYGGFFATFIVTPVLLIDKIGISPSEYGWVNFLGGGGAYLLAGFLNGKLAPKFGVTNMMHFGLIAMVISSILMIICYFLFGMNFYTIVIPTILFYFSNSFIWSNAYATAFTPFGHMAGYAAALYGFIQQSGGAAIGVLMSYMPDDNQVYLGFAMLISSVTGILSHKWSIKSNTESLK
ncbi:MAG UNVERIFIED_CONTAM: multidrug effflux MFS transporter [Rickettsiaceae bacterium]